MSLTPIEVRRVVSVHNHPKADRLEIIKVSKLATQFVAQKYTFSSDDPCVYFPPDMLIPEPIAEAIGVRNYLKHAVYPGAEKKSQCRIGAIRLRGVPSFGFGLPWKDVERFLGSFGGTFGWGDDVTAALGGVKYQPPPKLVKGDAALPIATFHEYTSIQHYYRYSNAIEPGTPVRITEKIHGTNSRVGYVQDHSGDMIFAAGSHRTRIKFSMRDGARSIYWSPLTENMESLLLELSRGGKSVVVFGEIFGHKVQFMDYGYKKGEGYRVYDISVDGQYLNWDQVCCWCDKFCIPVVPILHIGEFQPELVDLYISGSTMLAHPGAIKSKFKGREGIVITPLEEEYSDDLSGRLILKAVSPDYYEAS